MHMQRRLPFSTQILVLLAALLPAAALAGGTATVQSSGETMQLAWQDNGAVRMDTSGTPEYMIMRNGKVYSVSTQNGKPVVMDMSGMFKMFAAMAGKSGDKKSLLGHIDKVEATGATETVAGIEGRVYRITTTSPDGKTETVEAVLTDDPLVVAMTKAYMNAVLGMLAPEAADSLLAALPDDDRGLLRSGTDFKLASISDDEPAADRFELPAEPKSFAQMMQKAMQGMKQEQGK